MRNRNREPFRSRWKLAATGFVAGFGGGLASLGGGTLIIPLLSEWIGLDRHQARGTAMAVAGVTALAGAFFYGLHGSVAWNTLLWTGIPAALTAPLAARYTENWPDDLLRRGFALVLLAGALALWWHPGPGNGLALNWPGLWMVATGILAGLVAGVIGISGGPILAPLFVLGLGMPQQLAQGSSLNARLPAIVAGTLEDHREGLVCWRYLPLLASGDLAGAWLGTHAAMALPEERLRQVFVLLLLLIAIHEWLGRPLHAGYPNRSHGSYP